MVPQKFCVRFWQLNRVADAAEKASVVKIRISKSEIRNNIEIQMFKIRNIPKRYFFKGKDSWFRTLEFWSFGFVSDFMLRI